MAKSNGFKYENVDVNLENGLNVIDSNGELIDIIEETKKVVENSTDKKLTIQIKEYKIPTPREKKPKFSYSCPKCGKEFTLNVGDLNIKCGDCDTEFEVDEQ